MQIVVSHFALDSQVEVYILFVHIYLRAAVFVAGEQNPQTKAHEMERVDANGGGVLFFFFFFFLSVSLDVGHAALLARLPLPGMTWSGPPGTVAIRCIHDPSLVAKRNPDVLLSQVM